MVENSIHIKDSGTTFLFKSLKDAGFPQKVVPGARFAFSNGSVATVLTVKGTYEPETRILDGGEIRKISVELLGKIGYLIPDLDTLLENLPHYVEIRCKWGRDKHVCSFYCGDIWAVEENQIIAGVLLWLKLNAPDALNEQPDLTWAAGKKASMPMYLKQKNG